MLLIYAVDAFGWLTKKIGKHLLARKRAKNIRVLYYRAVSAAETAHRNRVMWGYTSYMN